MPTRTRAKKLPFTLHLVEHVRAAVEEHARAQGVSSGEWVRGAILARLADEGER